MPLRGSAEATTLAMAFNEMSTSLRGAQQRLLHDAFHDHLTQLPNRALFMDRLQRVIARKARYPQLPIRGAVHRSGSVQDRQRQHRSSGRRPAPARDGEPAEPASCANTTRSRGRPIAPATKTPRTAWPASAATSSRCCWKTSATRATPCESPSGCSEAVAVPLTIDGQEVFASVSIGIAVSSPEHRCGDELVRDADIAMYRAKSAGGDRYAVFDATMHQDAVERLQLETDLRRGIDRHEFQLRYQPIVVVRQSPGRRIRGAASVAASGSRSAAAVDVPDRRRRNRPHLADRLLGAARGVRGGGAVAGDNIQRAAPSA